MCVSLSDHIASGVIIGILNYKQMDTMLGGDPLSMFIWTYTYIRNLEYLLLQLHTLHETSEGMKERPKGLGISYKKSFKTESSDWAFRF